MGFYKRDWDLDKFRGYSQKKPVISMALLTSKKQSTSFINFITTINFFYRFYHFYQHGFIDVEKPIHFFYQFYHNNQLLLSLLLGVFFDWSPNWSPNPFIIIRDWVTSWVTSQKKHPVSLLLFPLHHRTLPQSLSGSSAPGCGHPSRLLRLGRPSRLLH